MCLAPKPRTAFRGNSPLAIWVLCKPLGRYRNNSLVGFHYKECGDAVEGFDDGQAALGAEDAQASIERVGGGAAWGDDRHAAAAGQAETGLRIDDVRIAFAADLDVLLGVAGGRDAGVGHEHILAR